MGAGQRGDVLPLGDTAKDIGVGLEDIGAATGDEVPEPVARVLILASGDGDHGVGPHFGQPLVILGVYRLLEPVDIILLHTPGDLDGLQGRIGIVGIHHQVHILADGLPRRPHPLHILAYRSPADLHLDVPGTVGHLLAHLLRQPLQSLSLQVIATGQIGRHPVPITAQQFVHRDTSTLSGGIPHGNVYGCHSPLSKAAPPEELGLEHPLPELFRIVHVQPQCVVTQGLGGLEDGPIGPCLSARPPNPLHAIVGADPRNDGPTFGIGIQPIPNRLLPLDPTQVCDNLNNSHCLVLSCP